MRTIAAPVGRGWEYLAGGATGPDGRPVHDWDAELAELPDLLAEKLTAPSVEAGTYDLVIDPSNLWLTIHESIATPPSSTGPRLRGQLRGHLVRHLGQAPGRKLVYGSPAMHVTGDRTVEHGLASIGYDDEGWPRNRGTSSATGILVGYQIDRRMAHLQGLGRSNGAPYADSPATSPSSAWPTCPCSPPPTGPAPPA